MRHLPRHRRPEHLQGLRPDDALPQVHLRCLAGPLRRLQEAVRRPPRADRGDAQERALRAARAAPASTRSTRRAIRARQRRAHRQGAARHRRSQHRTSCATCSRTSASTPTSSATKQQKNDILRHLLEDFAKPELNLRPSRVGTLDVIGNAYEFLIKNFASTSGKKAGEFYTPPEVSQLMAQLVDPQEGDEICDPTCGSGSLLMKCGRLIRERTGCTQVRAVRPGGHRQHLGARQDEHVPARRGQPPHRMGRHHPQPQAARQRRQPEALRRGRRQSALQPREVGLRRRRGRQVQPLPPRRAAAHQGRLRLHPAHDRNHEARHRPHGRGRAARRAVPRRGRRHASARS